MLEETAAPFVASQLAAPASGPVIAPKASPRRPFYVWHAKISPTLSTGKHPKVGDVLRGDDALAFEVGVANGELDRNYATPTDKDPEA